MMITPGCIRDHYKTSSTSTDPFPSVNISFAGELQGLRLVEKKERLLYLSRSLSENADEELAFPFSFHGITPNCPTITLKHTIQTICYGIMATNNVI